jgi:L,D-transpeptidase YcbB
MPDSINCLTAPERTRRVRTALWGGKLLVALLLFIGALSAGAITTPLTPSEAQAQSGRWWFPQNARERRDEMSLEDRRRQRELIQDALQARLQPEFQTTTPYASPDTIAALQAAIARYRAIVQGGGWPMVPDNQTLRVNDSGDAVVRLRHRLLITGDLTERSRRDWRYDADVELAVARFQMRHGLPLSGFVDSRTRRALNVPANERLQQLEINLARLTELMKVNKSDRYVMVNVPAYTLQAVQNGQLALSSAVVVGKPSRETPSVTATIKELNFYPYWRVPDSIAHRDLVPQIRKDPAYFYEQHFSLLKTWGAEPFDPNSIDWNSPQIMSYKFRQDPGPHNALGVVRINMPNKHIVYLHDTPLKQLFGRSSRAFSSGCVRVERVLDLAGWLLEGTPGWDPLKVQVTVAQAQPVDVKLKDPVPVHFVYVTAWANNGGIAHFRPDIYGRDGVAVEVADNSDDANDPRAVTP